MIIREKCLIYDPVTVTYLLLYLIKETETVSDDGNIGQKVVATPLPHE